MDIWIIILPFAFCIVILATLLSSIERKQSLKHLEKRLNHMEHMLHLIAEKMEIELNTISDKDVEIIRLADQGKKIAAIKHAREIYGFGLKEAKDYVEKLERRAHH